MNIETIRNEFEEQGRYWFRNCLSRRTLSSIDRAINLSQKPGERISVGNRLYDALAGDETLSAAMRCFGDGLAAVRVVAFNKTAESNWAVPWHQDRVIAVAARHDMEGFANWSLKRDVWHCEPPAAFLEQMYFVRLHLDDNAAADGCMRIALGSHHFGLIQASAAQGTAEKCPQEICTARRGDVLVLKMLTLHASSPSSTTNPRRVIRVDYAPEALLPPPLRWV